MNNDYVLESMASILVIDFDFTSIYPSMMVLLNSSRETLKMAVYKIEGYDGKVQRFTNAVITKRENAVMLGKEFFNLPSYTEMYNLIKAQLHREGTI